MIAAIKQDEAGSGCPNITKFPFIHKTFGNWGFGFVLLGLCVYISGLCRLVLCFLGLGTGFWRSGFEFPIFCLRTVFKHQGMKDKTITKKSIISKQIF